MQFASHSFHSFFLSFFGVSQSAKILGLAEKERDLSNFHGHTEYPHLDKVSSSERLHAAFKNQHVESLFLGHACFGTTERQPPRIHANPWGLSFCRFCRAKTTKVQRTIEKRSFGYKCLVLEDLIRERGRWKPFTWQSQRPEIFGCGGCWTEISSGP